jgi:RNA polymerase sigma factor (sigma-70 family)
MASQRWFATTIWNVIEAAGDRSSAEGREALEQLCRTYWYPIYYFVRRQGPSPEDAQDITQEFLARFLEGTALSRADRQLGRFRRFLLDALQNFLVDEWRQGAAKKRANAIIISWDGLSAEERYQHEPFSDLAPDKIFDRRWATALFQKAFSRLRDEFAAADKGQEFKLLKRFLSTNPREGEYAALAPRLNLSLSMVPVATHRLRRRYGELVRQEIAATVTNREEIEDEMRYLMALMSE